MTDERDQGPDPEPTGPDGPTDAAEPGSPGSSPDAADPDQRSPIATPDPTDHDKTPFHFVRALLLTMPLAILVGSVVAPPDAVAQLVLIAGTLVGGFPITYRLVANRRFGPTQLGAFFGTVLVVTLVGLWVLQAVGSGPVPDVIVRFAIVLVSLLVADLFVFRYLGVDGG